MTESKRSNIIHILWIFFLLALPVTSFPYFPGSIGGGASVRPLSVYPLIVLLILVITPTLWKRPLPRTLLPFLAFILAATASAVWAATQSMGELRAVSPLMRGVRGLAALGIGSAFYLAAMIIPRSIIDLRASLRWLYTGFGLALIWGSLQIIYVLKPVPQFFALMSQVQRFISSRKLMPKRVSGLTYEPKWFAEQICFLLVPWLLAAVVTRQSVFRWRWRWVTIELILLAWASIVLIFTYSRTGVFVLLILYSLAALLFWRQLFHFLHLDQLTLRQASFKDWAMRITLVCGVIILVLGTIYIAGTKNNYFARLWTFWNSETAGSDDYFEYIAFKQRFVYADTAMRIFEDYPLQGVGPGNYAFYFDTYLPNQPWNRQPDILRQITYTEGRDKLITPKNLFAKILAETGLIGFATFLVFILAILGCMIYLLLSSEEEWKYFGLAGLFGITAFVIIAFSFDSFAIPSMWILFGFITAACHLRKAMKSNPT
ncbi:MAG: O-antigen ligase family protein [Chloroflexota bacterium]